MPYRYVACCVALALALGACSDGKRAPAPDLASGATGGSEARGGTAALAGEGGTALPEAGSDAGGSAGSGGSAGAAEGGSAMSPGGAGPEPEPIPPVGDPPVCPRGFTFDAGTPLPISAAGDDVLQAVTPDELTIAWRNGTRFFVADRADVADPFGAALEVAGSAQYVAVTLSPDGLQLIGVKTDLSVVEQTRSAGMAFSDASPEPGDFLDFNATRASVPLGDQLLSDLVMSADEASLIYSHFTSGATDTPPTIFESRRSGSAWQFSSADLGSLLGASGEKRRVPTGISADSLTLFYRDDVQGDFKAAWRVNTSVPFDHAEALALGSSVQAAAPSRACSRVYYSAEGAQGLDLFVASVAD